MPALRYWFSGPALSLAASFAINIILAIMGANVSINIAVALAGVGSSRDASRHVDNCKTGRGFR